MDSGGGNRTQRLYKCDSNYALPKIILDNGLEDLWRRENQISLNSHTMIDPPTQDPG